MYSALETISHKNGAIEVIKYYYYYYPVPSNYYSPVKLLERGLSAGTKFHLFKNLDWYILLNYIIILRECI